MSNDNVEIIQRFIDITVAMLLVEGGLHADAVVIGRGGLAIELGGPALELEMKQNLSTMFDQLAKCKANSEAKSLSD